jgi:hypothetical protein
MIFMARSGGRANRILERRKSFSSVIRWMKPACSLKSRSLVFELGIMRMLTKNSMHRMQKYFQFNYSVALQSNHHSTYTNAFMCRSSENSRAAAAALAVSERCAGARRCLPCGSKSKDSKPRSLTEEPKKGFVCKQAP